MVKHPYIFIAGALFFLAAFLIGCASTTPQVTPQVTVNSPEPSVTSTPEPTKTPTSIPSPTPTATQLPITLKGLIFFDIDGSGQQNEIKLNYYNGLIHPKDQAFRQNPDLVKVLEDYILFHPSTKDGTEIAIMEPGLSNYEVCAYLKDAKTGCALTDPDGKFSLADTGIRMGDSIGITITDGSTDRIGTMAYQNRFLRTVIVPTYQMNNVQVPEQTLFQTNLMKLADSFYISASEEEMVIGLMQGFLPYPPLQGNPYIYSFFDHDLRKNYGLDWRGRTGITPKTFNHPPNKMTDNLDGVDIGGQKGDFVLSMGFGVATSKKSDNLGNQVIVMVDNVPHIITYSHLDTVLIKDMQEVFRGQIIGIVGRTGKDVGAPHIHLDIGSSGFDPFGDPKGLYSQSWTRAFSPAEFP